jgi:hypothetical protein
MSKAGGDLWSPAAVAVLKMNLREAVAAKWGEALTAKADTNGITNGDKPANREDTMDGEEKTAQVEVVAGKNDDVLIQTLFDILLLQNAFEVHNSTVDELVKLGESVEKKVELDAAAKKRVLSAAKEYWKRTSLLFGLLA